MNRDVDRRAAIQWARNILKSEDAVILDTETTGLDETAEVVQIGIIELKGNVVMDRLVKPVNPIPLGATSIHGITNEQVANEPSFADLYEEFCQAVYGKIVIIYNAAYDKRLIWQTMVMQANYAPVVPWLVTQCAMLRYAEYIGDWNFRRGSYRWKPLPAGDHSAIGDCQATLKLIRSMAETPLIYEEA